MRLRIVSRSIVCLAGVACAATALVACDVSVKDGSFSVGVLSGRATDEWTRRYPLASGGKVEIVNINGAIEVVIGEHDLVEVHATRTVKARTDEAARDLLKKLNIQEDVSASRIRLETKPPSLMVGSSHEVRYRVQIPRSSSVEVATTNGAVNITGVQGRVKASAINGAVIGNALAGGVEAATVNGAIRMDVEAVGSDGITLETTNGAIRLLLPEHSKASLSARCLNGGIAVTGLPLEPPGERRSRNLDAQLNGGGPKVELRTTNGGIRIEGKT